MSLPFSELENVISCSGLLVLWVVCSPQGYRVFCAQAQRGKHLGAGLANHSSPASAPRRLEEALGAPGSESGPSCGLALQPPARALRSGSTRAPTRRQVKCPKGMEGRLIQMARLFSKPQGSSPSHPKQGTHSCIGTAGTQLTSDCPLPQEGGGEWVVPDPPSPSWDSLVGQRSPSPSTPLSLSDSGRQVALRRAFDPSDP